MRTKKQKQKIFSKIHKAGFTDDDIIDAADAALELTWNPIKETPIGGSYGKGKVVKETREGKRIKGKQKGKKKRCKEK